MSRGAALLVDFGTSRVKGARLDLASGALGAAAELPAPAPRRGAQGEVEADPFQLRDTFRRILEATVGGNADGNAPPEAIWLCAEMHGFVLDDGKGAPLTPYISWRDERAGRDGAPSTLETVQARLGSEFQQITGMTPRPGLPAVVLAHLSRFGRLPLPARLLSLPEWLVASAGRSAGAAHASIAAASGLYDIGARCWSERILRETGSTGLGLNAVRADTREPIGSVDVRGRPVPLFGGIGDMQAAMLGAGIPARAAIAVNIGTGSQVARAVRDRPGLSGERRPFFAGTALAALTHIPAGRALNLFSDLVDGFAIASGGRAGRFWEMLAGLRPEAVLAAPLEVDLNVFSGAWRFKGGGAVAGLLEGNCSAEQLVGSVARAWLAQYAEAIRLLDPAAETASVALAGGLARRVPACVPVLGKLLGREVLPPAGDEETLLGLAALARGMPS